MLTALHCNVNDCTVSTEAHIRLLDCPGVVDAGASGEVGVYEVCVARGSIVANNLKVTDKLSVAGLLTEVINMNLRKPGVLLRPYPSSSGRKFTDPYLDIPRGVSAKTS
jgi:hypothetical protein